MYMCMCHQVSLISCLKSQFPLITNISPKQNPDLFIASIHLGDQYSRITIPQKITMGFNLHVVGSLRKNMFML